MPHLLAGLLAILQLVTPALTPQSLHHRLRSGQWLRMHVVAHDDSPEMQHLKLLVRDAVQDCYAAHAVPGEAMLPQARALLPELTTAARQAALGAGFAGAVEVTLATESFGMRTLGNMTIPAGDYPALMIRLGDARGQNWWGLLDPQTALALCAVTETEDGALHWDWSWAGLLAALLGLPTPSDA